jgi:signal transduction histidine kinase
MLVILLVSARLLQQRRLSHALVRTDRAKNEFLATLSHELRNQLAPMQHGVRALELGRDRPDVLRRALPAMRRQVEHMGRLLDDLLDLARIGSGHIELARRHVDLVRLVQAAADANEPVLQAAGLRFERELPQAPLWAEADPTRLSQVLANLLGNAAKYTPEGGVVRLALRAEGHEALIEVGDNGEGIPAEALGRVFEMFEQVDTQRDQARGGLGIGLALVQRLVVLHGGRVSVRSEGPGRGSCFSVWLPLVSAAAAPADA